MEEIKYKYNCEKCNFHTNWKYTIDRHNNTTLHKTGIRGKKPKTIDKYKCDKCDYKSSNKNNFLTHTLNNHKTKEERKKGFKYFCEKCDKGVFTKTSFDKHIETIKHKRYTN